MPSKRPTLSHAEALIDPSSLENTEADPYITFILQALHQPSSADLLRILQVAARDARAGGRDTSGWTLGR